MAVKSRKPKRAGLTATDRGTLAARYGRSTWAVINPYKAAKQRREWAAAREAAECSDDFEVVMRRAERAVQQGRGRDGVLAELRDAFPRHVRERGLTSRDLARFNPPAFDLLTHGTDSPFACAWCGLDARVVECRCSPLGTPDQRRLSTWKHEHVDLVARAQDNADAAIDREGRPLPPRSHRLRYRLRLSKMLPSRAIDHLDACSCEVQP